MQCISCSDGRINFHEFYFVYTNILLDQELSYVKRKYLCALLRSKKHKQPCGFYIYKDCIYGVGKEWIDTFLDRIVLNYIYYQDLSGNEFIIARVNSVCSFLLNAENGNLPYEKLWCRLVSNFHGIDFHFSPCCYGVLTETSKDGNQMLICVDPLWSFIFSYNRENHSPCLNKILSIKHRSGIYNDIRNIIHLTFNNPSDPVVFVDQINEDKDGDILEIHPIQDDQCDQEEKTQHAYHDQARYRDSDTFYSDINPNHRPHAYSQALCRQRDIGNGSHKRVCHLQKHKKPNINQNTI